MTRALRTLLPGCLLAVLPAMLPAQTDPMQPPAALMAPRAASVQGMPAERGSQRLSAIMLSKDRKFAVVDGQEVALGGRLGEARLVRLTETEATLRGKAETVVLKLAPDLKTPVGGAKSPKEVKK